MNTCTQEFSPLDALRNEKCNSGLLQSNSISPMLGQSGISGKTIFHQKVKSSKKPQGKFTSMKAK